MPTLSTLAQVAAADPCNARALHLISRIHGRLAALEAAIAAQDKRARLSAILDASQLFDELVITSEPVGDARQ